MPTSPRRSFASAQFWHIPDTSGNGAAPRTSAHIFEELTIFHNQQQVFALLLQDREVVERIPVYYEHICQGSRRQHTEFTRRLSKAALMVVALCRTSNGAKTWARSDNSRL